MPTEIKRTFQKWIESVPEEYKFKVLSTEYEGTEKMNQEEFMKIVRFQSNVTCELEFWQAYS